MSNNSNWRSKIKNYRTRTREQKAYGWVKHHFEEVFKANAFLSQENSELRLRTWALADEVEKMQKQVAKQEEEKERRVPKFELIQGGLGSGGNPPPTNWLNDFPVGTQFVCQSKMQRDNFMVLTLEIWRKTERTVRLWDIVSDKLFCDANPDRFINSFELLETLYDPRRDLPKQEQDAPKEETEEVTNG